MTQIMSMTDSYGYRPLVWDIYVETHLEPARGQAADEATIAQALPKARTYCRRFTTSWAARPFLADETPTLADFHCAPVFGYFVETVEGRRTGSGISTPPSDGGNAYPRHRHGARCPVRLMKQIRHG